jgi:hypothetical protein
MSDRRAEIVPVKGTIEGPMVCAHAPQPPSSIHDELEMSPEEQLKFAFELKNGEIKYQNTSGVRSLF